MYVRFSVNAGGQMGLSGTEPREDFIFCGNGNN
jgi:hypothetical protein